MDYKQMVEMVKEKLPEKRFLHSLAVVREMEKLCPLLSADTEKGKIAGILHDVTKPLTPEEQLKICMEHGIILDDVEQNEPKILHAITGSIIAKEEFGISDEEILLAIRYHTTARGDMRPLEKALYLADYIEDTRDFEGIFELRELVYNNMGLGLLKSLRMSIEAVLEKGNMIHPDTLDAWNSSARECYCGK